MTPGLLIAVALAADPAELQPGVQYAPGTTVQSSELGLAFTLPDGWTGGWPEGSDAMLLASDTHAGLVRISAEPGVGVADAQALLSQPLPLDLVTVLQPAGPPSVQGSDLTQRYRGHGLVAHGRGRVTEHAGVLFLVVGPEAESDRIEALAGTLIGSLKAVDRPTPAAAAAPAGGPTGALAKALAGRKLYHLKVKNGFSDEWNAYLCSDGTAIWSANHSAMSTGGGATLTHASQGSDRGTWTVTGSDLVLSWSDGSSGTYPLESRSDGGVGIGLDNHWVQDQDVCP